MLKKISSTLFGENFCLDGIQFLFGLNKLMLGPKMIMSMVVKFVFYYRGGSLRLKVYDLRGFRG
jgi:hypothetical protein